MDNIYKAMDRTLSSESFPAALLIDDWRMITSKAMLSASTRLDAAAKYLIFIYMYTPVLGRENPCKRESQF